MQSAGGQRNAHLLRELPAERAPSSLVARPSLFACGILMLALLLLLLLLVFSFNATAMEPFVRQSSDDLVKVCSGWRSHENRSTVGSCWLLPPGSWTLIFR